MYYLIVFYEAIFNFCYTQFKYLSLKKYYNLFSFEIKLVLIKILLVVACELVLITFSAQQILSWRDWYHLLPLRRCWKGKKSPKLTNWWGESPYQQIQVSFLPPTLWKGLCLNSYSISICKVAYSFIDKIFFPWPFWIAICLFQTAFSCSEI